MAKNDTVIRCQYVKMNRQLKMTAANDGEDLLSNTLKNIWTMCIERKKMSYAIHYYHFVSEWHFKLTACTLCCKVKDVNALM